jgi:hypothetical protein
MLKKERNISRRDFLKLAAAGVVTALVLNRSSGPALGREAEDCSTKVDGDLKPKGLIDKKDTEEVVELRSKLTREDIPTRGLPEINKNLAKEDLANIEYLGSCRSEEAIQAGPVCSRWSIGDEMVEVGGRGQIVSYGDSPSVWTFGTIKEDSCQPGRLKETCQTQERNQIFWLKE